MADRVSSTSDRIRVLVVEDNREVVETITSGLDADRFWVDAVPTLSDGMQRLSTRQYDAMILDLGLPDGDGLSLADTAREAGRNLPILVLTAKSNLDERLEGFKHGIDDYVCKPFSVEELVARLDAALRRAGPRTRHVLTYADVELDLLRRMVRRGNVQSSLSSRETGLLAFFLRNPEEPLPRARILEEVWGDEAEGDSNVVNVYVNYLRNKLEQGKHGRLIHTVRGVGYVLAQEPPNAHS
jgi:two-component system response regulator MprA